MKTPIVMCWSGGKDSSLAVHELIQSGAYDVVGLLTTMTEPYGRISMHGVRRELLHYQGASMGIPICEVSLSAGASNAEYERQMASTLRSFRDRGVMHVAFGDIFLEDLREYRERNLSNMGMTAVFPIWKQPTPELASRFVDSGFVAYTSCIDPSRLSDEFVGRRLDRAFFRDLPEDVDPCGENGEFHSFVCGGPVFRRPIPVSVGSAVRRDSFLFCDLLLNDTDSQDAGQARRHAAAGQDKE